MKESRPEADIIEGCKRGDSDAFRDLFIAHKDRVYSVALHFSGDETAARDVTQQVFLKLYTSISQFRRESEFTTWLYRIVVNACVDHQRKHRRFVQMNDDIDMAGDSSHTAQERAYHRKQISDSVRKAIAELSPKLRMPILLKYVEGLSYDEIASTLGCSIGTVSSRMNRGHKALAQKLGHLRGEISTGE